MVAPTIFTSGKKQTLDLKEHLKFYKFVKFESNCLITYKNTDQIRVQKKRTPISIFRFPFSIRLVFEGGFGLPAARVSLKIHIRAPNNLKNTPNR